MKDYLAELKRIEEELYDEKLTIERLDPSPYDDVDDIGFPDCFKFCYMAISSAMGFLLSDMYDELDLPEYAIDRSDDQKLLDAITDQLAQYVCGFWHFFGYQDMLVHVRDANTDMSEDECIALMKRYLQEFFCGFLYGWSGAYGYKLDLACTVRDVDERQIPMPVRIRIKNFSDDVLGLSRDDAAVAAAFEFIENTYLTNDVSDIDMMCYGGYGVIYGIAAVYDYDWFSLDDYTRTRKDMRGNYFVARYRQGNNGTATFERFLHVVEDNLEIECDENFKVKRISSHVSNSGNLHFIPGEDPIYVGEFVTEDFSSERNSNSKKKNRPHKKSKQRRKHR